MKSGWRSFPILAFAALLIGLVPGASAADAPKEAPGQAQVLHVTYYYLPG